MRLDRAPRVLIAPCSFKGSLTPRQAAEAIAAGFRSALPESKLTLCPLADGGEGTLELLGDELRAELNRCSVAGPLGEPTDARWGWLANRKTALVESAQAVGLPLVPADRRDPMQTNSRGLGELIRAALDAGAKSLWIGLGGTGTVDGGTGMLQTLGARFLDAAGNEIGPAGNVLTRFERADVSGLDSRLHAVELLVMCDILGPLLGPRGARFYMPQKGATPQQCEALEAGLKRLAESLEIELGRKVRDVPGAGAAGGLGAAMAGLGGKLVSGTAFVLDAIRLRERMSDQDLVIGGEGRLDEQTLEGKPILGLARIAKELDKIFVALCGSRAEDLGALHREGLTAAFTIVPGVIDESSALESAAGNLKRTAYEVASWMARL